MQKVSSIVSSKIGDTLSNIRTWKNVMYNVLENGLVGDGVTDDTAALQTLIDTAIAAGRKAIFFPHTETGGQYYVTALTNADQVDFAGDNASFVGGYSGVIGDMFDFAALKADYEQNKIDWDGTTIEVTSARSAHSNLKERIDDVENTAINSEVTESRIPLNNLSSNRLKTSTDADKVQLINLSDEVRSAMAGTTPIHATPAPGSLVEEYYADESVTPQKLKDALMGKNIFDKNSVTNGYYAEVGSGSLVANASYFASDFIKVDPSTDYTRNILNQLCFYDVDKVYISGVSVADPATFNTPATCQWIRASALLTQVGLFQIELGTESTSYEPYSYTLKGLILPVATVYSSDYISRVMENLLNPFVQTKVKMLGDSIVAGTGGTGYSPTGEAIGTTGQNANVTTATCWANSLRNLILDAYNKDNYLELDNPGILNNIFEGAFSKNDNAYLKWMFVSANTVPGQSIIFDFYGDHFSILYAKTSGSGILEVYVDDVKIDDLDTYGASVVWSVEAAYTGLTMGPHSVELRQAASKGVPSSGTALYIEALKIPKVVSAKNWGVSGITSGWIYDYRSQLIAPDDDIVILQVGTNDRSAMASPAASRTFFREIIDYAQAQDTGIILSVASPVSAANDDDPSRNFKMHVVDAMTSMIAKEYNMQFISNFEYLKRYAEYTGITVDSLLVDGLHPNDTGYEVMYEHIANSLGLSI